MNGYQKNPNITWDIVQANPDKPQNSDTPNITWDIICDNPDKPWNYDWLSDNPNLLRTSWIQLFLNLQ